MDRVPLPARRSSCHPEHRGPAVEAQRRLGANDVSFQIAEKSEPHAELSTPAKRARKCDHVFEDLKRKILTGELTSHSPITEQSLAQEYSCSQSTIREALLLLQQYGLVVRRGYQGTFVTDPSAIEAMLLLKLRTDIEITGIAKAAQAITRAQLDELRCLAEQFEVSRQRRDVFEGAELDRSLHLTLFRIAQMPVLEPMLVRTTIMLQRVLLPVPRPEEAWQKPAITPHVAVLDALETHDVEAASQALRAHILSSAVLLAPHIYGADLERLTEVFEKEPAQFSALAGA